MAQPHHQQLHPSLDLCSAVPMLLTDISKSFPVPFPRVVGCLSPGEVCVWAKGADKESVVCQKSKCPRLTCSCWVGFGCRGDQDRELPVVPATEATNQEKRSKSLFVKKYPELPSWAVWKSSWSVKKACSDPLCLLITCEQPQEKWSSSCF